MTNFDLVHANVEIGNIEESSFEKLLNEQFKDSNKIILVDENTHDHCLEYLITTFPSLEDAEVMLLPVGEENKVLEVCFQVWEAMSEYQISKNDLIINLGGGVVTDMGGFIASVFKRGLNFINIPTTLLGMVDASIGGKNGIDLGVYKNQIGVINHPIKIYIDPRFLATLPSEEWLNGLGEIFKHGLIANKELWDELKTLNLSSFIESENLMSLILKAIQVKVNIVKVDELEKGPRKILNFGHTVGHALESYCLKIQDPIGHGHAVALGMIAESYISFKTNRISERELMEVQAVITRNYNYVAFSEDAKKEVLMFMRNDKKNSEGRIKFALLDGIGKSVFDIAVEPEMILASLQYIDAAYSGN